MKTLASLTLAAACLLAAPAFAGPAGTGLTFTEEVAKKNQLKRAAEAQTKLQAAADCAAAKASSQDAVSDLCRAG